VEKKPGIWIVRVAVQVIDAIRVKGARAPENAVDLVALGQQQGRKVGTILTGDSSNQCRFHKKPTS
jgi:hypothetical protein